MNINVDTLHFVSVLNDLAIKTQKPFIRYSVYESNKNYFLQKPKDIDSIFYIESTEYCSEKGTSYEVAWLPKIHLSEYLRNLSGSNHLTARAIINDNDEHYINIYVKANAVIDIRNGKWRFVSE